MFDRDFHVIPCVYVLKIAPVCADEHQDSPQPVAVIQERFN
jgi:hypothetical protein